MDEVVEIIDRYDHACVPRNMTDNKLAYIQNEAISKECTRTLTVTKDTKQPIYAYYQLDNFYQNHRRSLFFSFLQLKPWLPVLRSLAIPAFTNVNTHNPPLILEGQDSVLDVMR
ncbi:ALA-interacting subunit 1 [Triticum urartu]|uniref:ALA-interacting subunit 1 n=1 Tax=Triticum urartu TaxID=4572 RepID=M7Z0N1_TRIUA|nr:ALA-interacting subunit 1 [Triticum urartu]